MSKLVKTRAGCTVERRERQVAESVLTIRSATSPLRIAGDERDGHLAGDGREADGDLGEVLLRAQRDRTAGDEAGDVVARATEQRTGGRISTGRCGRAPARVCRDTKKSSRLRKPAGRAPNGSSQEKSSQGDVGFLQRAAGEVRVLLDDLGVGERIVLGYRTRGEPL